MQNTLAILSFPPAATECSAVCVGQSDQDFAMSFGDVSIGAEEETASADPLLASLVVPLPWVGTVASLPAGNLVEQAMTGAVEDVDAGAEVVSGDGSIDQKPVIESEVIVAPEVSDGGANLRPVAIAPTVTGPDIPPDIVTSGSEAVQKSPVPVFLGSLHLDELPDVTPNEALATRQQSSHRPQPEMAGAPSGEASDPGSGQVATAEIEADLATEPATVIARNDFEPEAKAAFSDLRGPDAQNHVSVDPNERREVSAPSARPAIVTDELTALVTNAAHDVPTKLETPLPEVASREGDGAALSSITEAVDLQEPLQTQTHVASTFWERFFGNLAAPQPVAGSRSDITVSRLAAVSGGHAADVKPVPFPSGPLANLSGFPEVESQEPGARLETEDEVSTTEAPLTAKVRVTASLSEAQVYPAPVILVSNWSGDLGDGREQVDPALSPLTFLTSSFGSGATSGSPGLQSLPVQQVAAQLAGVLVQSSDNATELALAPEELGRVRLRLEPDAANPDRLVILINVERPETLDLFRRHAGELAEAIRAAGYSGADIGFGQQGQGSDPDRQPGSSSFGSGAPPEDPAPSPKSPRLAAGTTLDLRL